MGFLAAASDKPLKPLRILILLFFAVMHKLGLISNDRLKKTGIWLFLKGVSENVIRQKSALYASQISLNELYQTEYLSKYPGAIIATASFEEYVQPLCKNSVLIAASLDYAGGKVTGLRKNAFGMQKVKLLNEKGLNQIDVFYTDSFSDRSLMDISSVVYLVKNNGYKKIKG